MLIAVGVFGVGTIVLGLTSNYWVAFFAVMFLSAGDMISVFVRGAIVPLVTPDDKRGRVSAVENVFIGATNELGAFESGAVSQLVGVKSTVVGGGLATLGIVGIFGINLSNFATSTHLTNFLPKNQRLNSLQGASNARAIIERWKRSQKRSQKTC